MYYRYRKQRPGHCFQGRYGATLVGADGYPLRLTRYIHLNPVWTKAEQRKPVDERVKTLSEFCWSSYRGYAGLAKPEERIDYLLLGEMDRMTDKARRQAYRAYCEGMVGGEDEVLKAAKGRSRYAWGDDRFVEEAEDDLNEAKLRRAIKGDVDWPVRKTPGVEESIRNVCKRLELDRRVLSEDGRKLGPVKGLALEAICRISGGSQRDVARGLGIASDVTIGYQRRLLAKQMKSDQALCRRLESLLDGML
jgi:putative transposase